MSEVPDVPRPAAFSRRRVLGLGAGAGVLVGLSTVAGCSAGSDSGADGDTGKRAAQPVEVTPDVKTATAALAAIQVARQAVAATAQRFPALRPALSGLTGMHVAHERSLANAVPPSVQSGATRTPYAVPPGRTAALARLTAAEQKLHGVLGGLAVAAESGDFARLLASMSAAVSTHLAALAAAAPTGARG